MRTLKLQIKDLQLNSRDCKSRLAGVVTRSVLKPAWPRLTHVPHVPHVPHASLLTLSFCFTFWVELKGLKYKACGTCGTCGTCGVNLKLPPLPPIVLFTNCRSKAFFTRQILILLKKYNGGSGNILWSAFNRYKNTKAVSYCRVTD